MAPAHRVAARAPYTIKRWRPGEAVWVSSEGVGEDLQRDITVQAGVMGTPRFAHAAFTQFGGDLEDAEGSTGFYRHTLTSRRLVATPTEVAHSTGLRLH